VRKFQLSSSHDPNNEKTMPLDTDHSLIDGGHFSDVIDVRLMSSNSFARGKYPNITRKSNPVPLGQQLVVSPHSTPTSYRLSFRVSQSRDHLIQTKNANGYRSSCPVSNKKHLGLHTKTTECLVRRGVRIGERGKEWLVLRLF
jgi:hypothetical protein